MNYAFLLAFLLLTSCTPKSDSGSSTPSPSPPASEPGLIEWDSLVYFGNEEVTITWKPDSLSKNYYIYRLKSDVIGYSGPILNEDNVNNYEVLSITTQTTLTFPLKKGQKHRLRVRASNEKGFSPWSSIKQVIGSAIYPAPIFNHLLLGNKIKIQWDTSSSLIEDPQIMIVDKIKNSIKIQSWALPFDNGSFEDTDSGEVSYEFRSQSRAGLSLKTSLVHDFTSTTCLKEDRALGNSGINYFSNESISLFKTLQTSSPLRIQKESYNGGFKLYTFSLGSDFWIPTAEESFSGAFDLIEAGGEIFDVRVSSSLQIYRNKALIHSSTKDPVDNLKILKRDNELFIAIEKNQEVKILVYNLFLQELSTLNYTFPGLIHHLSLEKGVSIFTSEGFASLDNNWAFQSEPALFLSTSHYIKKTSKGFTEINNEIENLWPLKGNFKLEDAKIYNNRLILALILEGKSFLLEKKEKWISLVDTDKGLKDHGISQKINLIDGDKIWADAIHEVSGKNTGYQYSCP